MKKKNVSKMGQRMRFLNLLRNLFYNERLYYFLRSCANPMFGKIWFLRHGSKLLLANQNAGFLNQLYFQNRIVK